MADPRDEGESEPVGADSFSDLASLEGDARALVDAFVQPSIPTTLAVVPPTLGRFTVHRRLGEGGMGIVYAGHDHELDRPVAIKLVRGAWLRGPDAAERLRREAQALARLSHPNVIAVYEVGEHVDAADPLATHVFIAMELVQGQTLNAWLQAGDRSQRAILDALVQAGRGLAAAHDAGLVHRDVKPTNVMIGDDGRVRLMDFGLARREIDPSASDDGLAGSVKSGGSSTSDVAGTPGYMAPEQREGGAIGPRADQYAFCVMAWESLTGERPGGSGKARMPAHLHRALSRGLERDPDARFADMHALLGVLARDRSRRWLMVGAVAVLASVTTLAVVRARTGVDCDADAMAHAIWNDDVRTRVHAALVATGVPYAESTWARTQTELDAWIERWSATRADACEGDARLSEVLRTAQARCLAQREQAFAALVQVLEEADRTSMEKVTTAVIGLPRVEPCSDVDYLAARVPPPDDAEVAAQVEDVRARLSRARALDDAGRHAEGAELAQALVEESRTFDYPPVLADSLVHLGRLAEGAGRYADAESALRDGHAQATASGDDAVAAEAAIRLVYVVGYRLARHDAGLEWAYFAEPELRRAGADPASEASLLHNLAAVHELRGEHAEALSLYQRAFTLREATLAADHPSLARTMDGIAAAQWMLGDYEAALAGYRRSLALRESLLGPDHPGIASSLQGLADVSFLRGEHDQALVYYERARDVMERGLGPEHPRLATLLSNMGALYTRIHKLDLALAQHERALAIRRANLAPGHPEIAVSLENIGNVHYHRAEYDQALALHQQALAIREQAFGRDHLDVAISLMNMSNVYSDLARYDEARVLLERALAIREASFGPDHPKVVSVLESLGWVQYGKGQLAEARVTFERVLAARERTLAPDHPDIADTHHMLGVIATRQHEPDRALVYLRHALGIIESAKNRDDTKIAAVLVGLSDALVASGDGAEGLAAAERALAIRERPDQRPLDLADARAAVARALVASGGDRKRAFELADAAAAAYRERPDAAAVLAKLETWRRSVGKRAAR